MSIIDPVLVVYDEKRESFRLLRGRETFYDENNNLREWDTAEEAEVWAHANLPFAPAIIRKFAAQSRLILEPRGDV